MDPGLAGDLERLAQSRGSQGFTFDDLAVVAVTRRARVGDVVEWLASSHASGLLLDLGYETLSDGTVIGPRRYCAASFATPGQRLDLRLPAEPASVRTMRWAAAKFAEAHGLADLHAVELAVSEAVTNAVVHAYTGDESGDVRMVICAEPERLVLVVRDWGERGMAPRLDTPGLGVGLPTVASVASYVNIESPEGGGTLVRMHFAREAALAPEQPQPRNPCSCG